MKDWCKEFKSSGGFMNRDETIQKNMQYNVIHEYQDTEEKIKFQLDINEKDGIDSFSSIVPKDHSNPFMKMVILLQKVDT